MEGELERVRSFSRADQIADLDADQLGESPARISCPAELAAPRYPGIHRTGEGTARNRLEQPLTLQRL